MKNLHLKYARCAISVCTALVVVLCIGGAAVASASADDDLEYYVKWRPGLGEARPEPDSTEMCIADLDPADGFLVLRIHQQVSASITYRGWTPEGEAREGGQQYYQKAMSAGDNLIEEISFSINEELTTDDRAEPAGETHIDTVAAEDRGETPVSVPAAFVIGLAGAAAAAGGAAGGTGDHNRGDSSAIYRMVLCKEFGNSIRLDGEQVFVYARMVQITEEGEEIPRPDLTRHIEIFSDDSCLEVGPATIYGQYMGASVRGVMPEPSDRATKMHLSESRVQLLAGSGDTQAVRVFVDDEPGKAAVSFRFAGHGGVFRNNVTFDIVSDGWEYDADLRFDSDETKVDLDVEVDESSRGSGAVVNITETLNASLLDELKDSSLSVDVVVSARSSSQEISSTVTVLIWQEGLFLTRATKRAMMDGRVPVRSHLEPAEHDRGTEINLVAVKWDEEKKEAIFDDELIGELEADDLQTGSRLLQNAYDTIGMEFEFVGVWSQNMPTATYRISFNDVIPAEEERVLEASLKIHQPAAGDEYSLRLPLSFRTKSFMGGGEDWEREYENCLHIIEKYLPEELRDAKLRQLEHCRDRMGVNELTAFRQEVWKVVTEQLEMQRRYWMEVSAWYDSVLYRLQWAEWAGQRASNALASTFLTPYGATVAGLGQEAFTSFLAEMLANWDRPAGDTFRIWADQYVKTITDTSVKKLIGPEGEDIKYTNPRWLALFVVYRFTVHLASGDDSGRSVGFYEAARRAATDLGSSARDDAVEAMLESAIA